MEKYIYELKMKVRDYECDLQGIVNNANYQHYLEHTRHEFLTSVGISFARLHEEGVDPVVARLTMAFKTPLRSGDEFVSKLYLEASRTAPAPPDRRTRSAHSRCPQDTAAAPPWRPG